jgi:SAM-dependent methyltransferase
MKNYTRKFYESQRERSRISAREIVPLVIEQLQPKSVVDIGCGSGAWLSVFREHGVNDIFGMDGSWVDQDMLFIPAELFTKVDLKEPIRTERQFDLVLSLEVAEHIPAEFAGAFVDSLTRMGSAILFSAAIPGQGGTHHVNEQWPDYWVRLFEKRGFTVIDSIRKKVWQNDKVEWWYAQNLLLFVHADQVNRYPQLRHELDNTDIEQLSIVHPKQFLASKDPKNSALRPVLAALPGLFMDNAKDILRTCFNSKQNVNG